MKVRNNAVVWACALIVACSFAVPSRALAREGVVTSSAANVMADEPSADDSGALPDDQSGNSDEAGSDQGGATVPDGSTGQEGQDGDGETVDPSEGDGDAADGDGSATDTPEDQGTTEGDDTEQQDDEQAANDLLGEELYSDAAGTLYRDKIGIKFVKTDGTLVTKAFYTAGDDTYYFGADGYALSGLQTIDGKVYYFDESTCVQVIGLHTWKDGSTSYFSPKHGGAAGKNWWKIGDARYYFDSTTRRSYKGSKTIDGKSYLFKTDGSVTIGWHTWSDGTRSYYSPKHGGAAAKGRWAIDGSVYYFDSSTRRTVMGWYTWADGARSYFSPKHGGAAAKGRWAIDGKVYYFNTSSRKAVTGWFTWSDGKRSYFSPKHGGAAAQGWWNLGGNRYFFNRTTRKALTGKWKVSGKTYYFGSTGAMRKGWVFWNSGGMSYFGSDGVMYTGSRQLYGTMFNFGSDGIASTSDPLAKMVAKAQQQTSPSNYLLMVNTDQNYVGVFRRSGGDWYLHKYFRCSTGALGVHQTPGGTFSVGYRGYVFGHGYSCYWYTQINKGILFHSVTYVEGTYTVLDGRLGMHISNGCVRLDINNAKWIYDNIPSGTTVRVYRG